MTKRSEDALFSAWVVVLAGVVSALQVGKLPPALTALQADLGLTLVQSGFLLSMVQLAGMLTAVVVGLLADRLGLKRAMVSGLVLLAAASALGSLASSAAVLLILRAIEGMGFLWVTLPAPALIRRLVPVGRLAGMIGVWGTYMPLGTALALLGGPFVIPIGGWPLWWNLFALLSLAMAIWLYRAVPADPPSLPQVRGSLVSSLAATLSAPGPWLVALMFCVYSAQWLAVVGFLPSIYAGAGLTGATLGVLTALAAGANVLGNVASGRLLQAGHQPHRLLWVGFGGMAVGSSLAFMAATEALPVLRYGATLLFFSVGGLVPGTLFALAVRLAPGERQVAGTVGWVLQWSALGQFFGPPAMAWVAAQAGGWQQTPLVTGSCCALGAALAWLTARHIRRAAKTASA
ncbi:MAG: MFS transporter [Betaproteobacteria bacterium]